MQYVIFSVDKHDDLWEYSRFVRHMATQKAMMKMTGDFIFCQGSYKGVLEPSFMMMKVDFDKHVRDTDYVKDQECFMYVSHDIRQPALLVDPEGNVLSSFKLKTYKSIPDADAWTYRYDLNVYWTAEK